MILTPTFRRTSLVSWVESSAVVSPLHSDDADVTINRAKPKSIMTLPLLTILGQKPAHRLQEDFDPSSVRHATL